MKYASKHPVLYDLGQVSLTFAKALWKPAEKYKERGKKWPEKLQRYAPTKKNQESKEREEIEGIDWIDIPVFMTELYDIYGVGVVLFC